MGNLIQFKHSRCHFLYNFRFGKSVFHFRFERTVRKDMRSGKLGDHWKEMMDQYPDGTATVTNALCYCPVCKQFQTEAQISFYKPKEGYQPEFSSEDPDVICFAPNHFELVEKEEMYCQKCGGKVEVFEDYMKVPCPKCGEYLDVKAGGWWD